jgi:hypothetical protein
MIDYFKSKPFSRPGQPLKGDIPIISSIGPSPPSAARSEAAAPVPSRHPHIPFF